MADDADPVEQISFLTRSESRIRVLERLLEAGAASQRELRTRLEASRSTIARTLTALENRDLIEKADGAYRLTPVGEIIAEEFRELIESIRVTDELSTFLNWFPYSEFDLDVVALRDATITTSTSSDPYAPGRRQTEVLQSAGRFHGVLPVIDLEGSRVAHERITECDLEAEIVVTADVAETITTGEFAELFREKLETGQLTVLVHDDDLPFYLGLADDDVVQIGVEDDDGFPRALLETESASVRSWGETVYRTYRAEARPMSLDEF